MRQRFFFVLTIALLFTWSDLNAQVKRMRFLKQAWLGYFNQTRFGESWGLWTDLQLRTREDFTTNFSQAIGRLGITYYLKDELKITAGYAYVNHFPNDDHKNISRPEHRGWQQVQWHNNYEKLRMMQWFRLEERWRRRVLSDDELAEGYSFNFRARYNFLIQFPFSRKKFEPGTFSGAINNEVHINFGKEIVYNYFDQNRFFAGINYHVNAKDNIQLGYLNVFQQLPAGESYTMIHAARLFYFHNLDLRKSR